MILRSKLTCIIEPKVLMTLFVEREEDIDGVLFFKGKKKLRFIWLIIGKSKTDLTLTKLTFN